MTKNISSSDVKDFYILPEQNMFPNFHHPIISLIYKAITNNKFIFDLV